MTNEEMIEFLKLKERLMPGTDSVKIKSIIDRLKSTTGNNAKIVKRLDGFLKDNYDDTLLSAHNWKLVKEAIAALDATPEHGNTDKAFNVLKQYCEVMLPGDWEIIREALGKGRSRQPLKQTGKSDWVDCPICGDRHMQKVWDGDEDEDYYIYCTNMICKSNGGDAVIPATGNHAELVERLKTSLHILDKSGPWATTVACDITKAISALDATPEVLSEVTSANIGAVFKRGHDLLERNAELEEQHYQIMLEICGGEDAPGFAASLGLEDVKSIMADYRKEQPGNPSAPNEGEKLAEEMMQLASILGPKQHFKHWKAPLEQAAAELRRQPDNIHSLERSGDFFGHIDDLMKEQSGNALYPEMTIPHEVYCELEDEVKRLQAEQPDSILQHLRDGGRVTNECGNSFEFIAGDHEVRLSQYEDGECRETPHKTANSFLQALVMNVLKPYEEPAPALEDGRFYMCTVEATLNKDPAYDCPMFRQNNEWRKHEDANGIYSNQRVTALWKIETPSE